MARYVVLLNFTGEGISAFKTLIAGVEGFRATAAENGAAIEALFWTLGNYDGVLILTAPDEATASALVLELGKTTNVRTCMLRAFDTEEFSRIVGKIE